MNKKKVRYSLNFVLGKAQGLTCKDLHHRKSQQHEIGYVCPAEYELAKNIAVIDEYIKENLR